MGWQQHPRAQLRGITLVQVIRRVGGKRKGVFYIYVKIEAISKEGK